MTLLRNIRVLVLVVLRLRGSTEGVVRIVEHHRQLGSMYLRLLLVRPTPVLSGMLLGWVWVLRIPRLLLLPIILHLSRRAWLIEKVAVRHRRHPHRLRVTLSSKIHRTVELGCNLHRGRGRIE